MERLVSPCETIRDEPLKEAVMLVHAVEERADVAVPAVESARIDLQISVRAFHASPPSEDGRVQRSPYPLAASAGSSCGFRQPASRAKSLIADLRNVRLCTAARFLECPPTLPLSLRGGPGPAGPAVAVAGGPHERGQTGFRRVSVHGNRLAEVRLRRSVRPARPWPGAWVGRGRGRRHATAATAARTRPAHPGP